MLSEVSDVNGWVKKKMRMKRVMHEKGNGEGAHALAVDTQSIGR
jgi:hypothetical protein